jgi:NSS family neurotransmitter:Na+ symporter
MPEIFSNLGDYGIVIVASLFFFLLLLAGITSSISLLQVPVSSLQDSLNMSKDKAAIIISILVLAFGMFSALSYSPIKLTVGEQDQTIPFLDLVDSWFGTHGLAISAAIFVIAVTWFMDKKIIMQQLNLNSPIKLPFWVLTVVKFVLPVLIISTVISQIIIL